MKRFRFRLHKVLNYRLAVEEIAKEAYIEARVARLEGEVELQRIKDARKELLFLPADTLEMRKDLERALECFDDHEREQTAANRVLQEDEETRRLEWMARKQDAEALTKLREKAMEAYNAEATRHEQKSLDEWATRKKAA